MRDVADPFLAGKIFRHHVKGPDGYRYIYLYLPEHQLILPVFVSLEQKSRFKYEEVAWEAQAQRIVADFSVGNWERFKEFT